MSIHYSSSVFFGTYVDGRSPLGAQLRELIDEQDGVTPAETSHENVEISECGSWPEGKIYLTVQIAIVDLSFSKDEPIGPPRALPDSTGWKEQILAFLADYGVDAMIVAPIGWYFESSAS